MDRNRSHNLSSPKGDGRKEAGTQRRWRKRLRKGCLENQPTFQLLGALRSRGVQVARRKRNIITLGRDREEPGLRGKGSPAHLTRRALPSLEGPALHSALGTPPPSSPQPGPRPQSLRPARLRLAPQEPSPWGFDSKSRHPTLQFLLRRAAHSWQVLGPSPVFFDLSLRPQGAWVPWQVSDRVLRTGPKGVGRGGSRWRVGLGRTD